jgi:molybdopterin molybdotransferase
VISLQHAQQQLWASARCRQSPEILPLAECLGRYLAEPITALCAVPPADNSAMDGYALRHQDLGQPLPISQRIPAGRAPEPLAPGTAARLFTGSEIPPGADTVVMQENTRIDQGLLQILQPPRLGENIRPRGQDITLGNALLSPGQRLSAVALGLLASQGLTQVRVYSPVKVALINSGDELVAPGQPLSPGQIYNSNGSSLAALLSAMGCQVHSYQLPDNLDASCSLLSELAPLFPVLISTGGVSVGEEDHLRTALQRLGEVNLWKLALKPGKPFMAGRLGDSHWLGLPGNPVSALVTFLLLAKPFIQACQGGQASLSEPYWVPVRCALRGGGRDEYLRVVRLPGGLEPLLNQSSGVLRSLHQATGLALLPASSTLAAGDSMAYWPLAELLA